MFGIQSMSMRAAIPVPQMIEMDLDLRLSIRSPLTRNKRGRKHLTVDGPVFLQRLGHRNSSSKLRRASSAIAAPNHELGKELNQQPLFQLIAQSIAIGISFDLRGLCRNRRTAQSRQDADEKANALSESRHSSFLHEDSHIEDARW